MQLLRRLEPYLAPPVFADTHKTRLAELTNRFLLMVLIGGPLALTLQIGLGLVVSWANVGIIIACILISLALRAWMRSGAVLPAAIGFIALLWVAVTAELTMLGTIRSLHLMGYVVAITLAALLTGSKIGLVTLLFSLAAVSALATLEQMGRLPAPAPLTASNQVLVAATAFSIFLYLMLSIRQTVLSALHKAEAENVQRRRIEEELRAVNACLDEHIDQRTRALADEVARHAQTEEELRHYSDALSINEARFRSIYENTPFAYQSLDENGCFLALNQNLCDLLGYERQELLGRPFGDFWPPENRPAFPDRFNELKNRGIIHADLPLLRKDGQKIMTILEGRVQASPDGRFVRTHCILTDVTERHQLHARMRRHNDLFASVYQSMADFLSHRSIDDLFQALVEQATLLLDAPLCEINTIEGNELVTRASSNEQVFLIGDRSRRDEAHLAWQAVATREPVVLEDYQRWPQRRPIYNSINLHAVAEIPILSGDGQACLGTISIGRSQPDAPFTLEEIHIARLYTQVASLAIENAQLHNELHEQSIHDPLTGLFNRRYLFETIQRELSRARRENYLVSVVLLDIDLFKQINDQYGHKAGDTLLCAVADQFKAMVRAGDILCRYGGDEHLVILYNTSLEVAQARAEQWRQAIEAVVVEYEGKALRITVSMGVAAFPDQGQSIDQVIACADQALYHSKNNGRNQVTVFQMA